MSWIEQRTPSEIAAQIRAVHLSRAESDVFDSGWRSAVDKVAALIESQVKMTRVANTRERADKLFVFAAKLETLSNRTPKRQ